MTTTYSTRFDRGRVVKSIDGLTNVLTTVAFTIVATSSDGYTKILKKYFDLPAPGPDTFTDISQVTEEMIVSWIEQQPDYLTDSDKQSLEFRLNLERERPTYEDYKFSWMPNDELRFNLVN
jgi:hypothetical protein